MWERQFCPYTLVLEGCQRQWHSGKTPIAIRIWQIYFHNAGIFFDQRFCNSLVFITSINCPYKKYRINTSSSSSSWSRFLALWSILVANRQFSITVVDTPPDWQQRQPGNGSKTLIQNLSIKYKIHKYTNTQIHWPAGLCCAEEQVNVVDGESGGDWGEECCLSIEYLGQAAHCPQCIHITWDI